MRKVHYKMSLKSGICLFEISHKIRSGQVDNEINLSIYRIGIVRVL